MPSKYSSKYSAVKYFPVASDTFTLVSPNDIILRTDPMSTTMSIPTMPIVTIALVLLGKTRISAYADTITAISIFHLDTENPLVHMLEINPTHINPRKSTFIHLVVT